MVIDIQKMYNIFSFFWCLVDDHSATLGSKSASSYLFYMVIILITGIIGGLI